MAAILLCVLSFYYWLLLAGGVVSGFTPVTYPARVSIARNVIHFSDICYLRTKTNNNSTVCLLWLLEKLINFIGALKHRLLPQVQEQGGAQAPQIFGSNNKYITLSLP